MILFQFVVKLLLFLLELVFLLLGPLALSASNFAVLLLDGVVGVVKQLLLAVFLNAEFVDVGCQVSGR